MSLLKLANDRGVSDALELLKLAGKANDKYNKRQGAKPPARPVHGSRQPDAKAMAEHGLHFPLGKSQGEFEFTRGMPPASPKAPPAAMPPPAAPDRRQLMLPTTSSLHGPIQELMHGPIPEIMHGPVRQSLLGRLADRARPYYGTARNYIADNPVLAGAAALGGLSGLGITAYNLLKSDEPELPQY